MKFVLATHNPGKLKEMGATKVLIIHGKTTERIGLLDAMIAGDAETAAELLARHFRFAETDPKP